MKEENLKDYIGSLLNTQEVDEKILSEIVNAKLVLTAYRLGLEKKELISDIFLSKLDLEENIPASYHIAIAQIAILKSKNVNSRTVDYLLKNIDKLLKDFKDSFSKVSDYEPNK